MSSTIIINSKNITNDNNSNFTYNIDRNIDFTNKEIALASATLYYSWRNITEGNNIFEYKFPNDASFTRIIIPPGFYEISDLNDYIHEQMKVNNHYAISDNFDIFFIDIVVNPTLYAVQINVFPVRTQTGMNNSDIEANNIIIQYTPPTFTGSNTGIYPIIRIPSKLNEILGFTDNYQSSSSYVETSNPNNVPISYLSQYAPNVNPNSTLSIICDQATNEFKSLGVLYALSPSVKIGSLITEKPSELIYLPLKYGMFNYLSFRLINTQTDEQMVIQDPNIVLTFNVRNIK